MKWKDIVLDYLTFTRKERIGIIVVLLIIVLAIFFPILFSQNSGTEWQTADTSWIAAVKKLEQGGRQAISDTNETNEKDFRNNHNDHIKNKYMTTTEAFYFDPNTLSKDNWQKLGVRDKTIQIIQNYLAKGGRFKKPEDLQKIYSLHKDEYERLAPFIKIENGSTLLQKEEFKKESITAESEKAPKKTFHYDFIDINTADTTALASLPGIGNKLSARIINFRDKLGGFYSVNQVKETYGLPDSTFQKIRQYLKLESISLRKININAASPEELKSHPYINYPIANAIVSYRNEHGPFSSLEDLKKIMTITDEVYRKISPYLLLQ